MFLVELIIVITTGRVLSKTKAIMSPPVCHWMESKFCVEEGEIVI